MKYLKKKEKKKTGKYIAIVLIVCVLLAAAVWMFMNPADRDEMASAEETVLETDAASAEMHGQKSIDTPYGTISISEQWVNNLRINVVEGDCYTLEFAAQVREDVIPLFDLHFNTVSGNFLGYVTAVSGEQVRVSTTIYEIVLREDWSKEEQSMIFGMQDELNNILMQLAPKNQADYSAIASVGVSTAYGELRYPAVWHNYLRTEVKDNVVCFYGKVEGKEEVRLFDFIIGGNGGQEVGALLQRDGTTVMVSMVTYDFAPDSSWSEEEIRLIHGMQDVVSFVIAQLSADNTPTSLKPAADMISVRTDYGTISYSGMWGSILKTEVKDNMISFFGNIEGHSEVHLFDIVLGGPGEALVGCLEGNVKVYVNQYPFAPDDTWSQEDTHMIYGMQDIMNDIIAQLSPAESTSPADNAEDSVTVKTGRWELRYPNTWGEMLQTEVKNNVVQFSGKLPGKSKVHLFDVSVGGSGKMEVGVLTLSNGDSAAVYITTYEFEPTPAWSDEEINIIHGMYDTINDIISQFSPVAQKPDASGDIVIHTAYADLHYPARWRDSLRTEVKENEVRFYAKMEGKGEVPLFDIVIGAAGDNYVGLLTGENGETTEVYMNYYEVTEDNGLSESEINQVYAMQEDMNYILEQWIEADIFSA